ncbi:MAG: dual specificity protein phosphatase family protein [Alphaproteobacteria bacterium]|nr:dual specificity protein phosphatase family protein [Alphaproteobacteria bacterium]
MIALSGLAGVKNALCDFQPVKLVSLLDAPLMPATPDLIKQENHLKLELNDISDPTEGLILPNEEHVDRLLAFGKNWTPPSERLLIHCWAGVSRSPAALLILLVQKNPGREADMVMLVRSRAPHIRPNPRLIELGDRALGCQNRLTSAARSMQETPPHDLADRYVEFPVSLAMAVG